MGDVIERFPLFPLGLVLLPHEALPLHIFEERYKTMIGECLDEEREFGIVWLGEAGLRDVGCRARITQVLERMPDGRMNILVEGTGPFRLLRRIDELDYPAGDVELIDDEAEAEDAALAAEARERYADLVEHATDSRPEPADLERLDAYGMAATVEFALDAKQRLLEERSERSRLELLAELFTGALKQMKASERAAERAQGNGKVRFGA